MNPDNFPKGSISRPMKRHKKLHDNIMGITRPAIRRLARRGGVERMKKDIYDEVRKAIKDRITEILRIVVLVLESSDIHCRQRKVNVTALYLFF
ncbi:hypothetical protein BDV23DRAFT_180167 [Aspergillus alliaceus]|uniref:Histone H4 n=1 Tax=Petromyces alliaceus TaxID=209559 RepID=A0A5N7CKP2_PETAA|nr:hypothetical protein BDV23DRAFT_180167 [Aspergillus alliaceus]